MYADRYARPEGIKPGSLTVAIALNAAVLGALLFASPAIREKLPIKTIDVVNIPIDPPPQPIPPEIKAKPHQPAKATPERIETSIAVGGAAGDYPTPLDPPLPPLPFPGVGEPLPIDPPKPAPVLTGAQPDPRYARDLQPPYPPGERRAEREGAATLRLTIGVDGRVKEADCLSADSDGFCRASRNQALSKWRFRPATRDGVPIEATLVKTVRFELEM